MNLYKFLKLNFLIIILLFFNLSLTEDIDLSGDLLDFDNLEEVQLRSPNYEDALNTLIGLGLEGIISQDFFKSTVSLNKRPIESLPSFWFVPNKYANQNWIYKFSGFYNQTSKMFFTSKSAKLGEYIRLNKEFFEVLDEDSFGDLLPDLGVLEPGKVQERRVGIFFQLFKHWQNFNLELDTSLFYNERNYFYTEDEEAIIKNEFQIGSSDNGNGDSALLAIAVGDKLGLGDTKIKLRFPIFDEPDFYISGGVFATLPTAFTLKHGLIGSNFRNKVTRPDVDIKELICLQDDFSSGDLSALTKAGTIVGNIALKAIDRMSEVLLETPTGNGGHLGLGVLFEPQFTYNDSVEFLGQLSLEYLLPATEKRFFIKKKNSADFDDLDPDTEAEAKTNIQFLDEQVINTIFPEGYYTKVHPGLNFQFTFGPKFKLEEYSLQVGYDYWFRQKESYGPLKDISSNEHDSLNKALNKPFHSAQSKVFGKLDYKKINPAYDWNLGLAIEKTVGSSGIGKDFNLAIVFEVNI